MSINSACVFRCVKHISVVCLILLWSQSSALPATCLAPLSYPAGLRDYIQLTKVRDVKALSDGHILVLFDLGFLLDLPPGTSNLQDIEKAKELGHINVIETLDNDEALIGSDNGLFLFSPSTRNTEKISLARQNGLGAVHAVQKLSDGRILIGSQNGLFQLMRGAQHLILVPLPSPFRIGGVKEIQPIGHGRILVLTESDIFRISDKGGTTELLKVPKNSAVIALKDFGDGWTVTEALGADRFAISEKSDTLIPIPPPIEGVEFLPVSEGRAFARQGNNIFLVSSEAEKAVPVHASEPIGEINVIVGESNGTLVVDSSTGLFVVLPQSTALVRAIPASQTASVESHFAFLDGRLILGDSSNLSLFDISTEQLVPLHLPPQFSQVGLDITLLDDGRLVFLSDSGAYVLHPKSMSLQPLLLFKPDDRKRILQGKIQGSVLLDGRYLLRSGDEIYILSQKGDYLEKVPHVPVGEIKHVVSVNNLGAFIVSDSTVLWLATRANRLEVVGDSVSAARMLYSRSNYFGFNGTTLLSENGDLHFF